MKMKLPLKVLLALVVLGFGMSAAGYDWAYCRSKLLQRCKVSVARLEVEPRLGALASGQSEATVTLDVSNPFPVSLTLAAAKFTFSTGGKSIGQAQLEGPAVTLPGRVTTQVPMRVLVDMQQVLPEVTSRMADSLAEMKLKDLGTMARNLDSGKLKQAMRDLPIEVRAEGEVVLDTPLGNGITLPVKATRKGARAGGGPEPGEVRQW
ncbi:MAG: LEA type 2 family protein [Candidatus Wallbacteria bacterium]|nr:LEA type 2 family protein [Candidatus Wallbacteria bacterium]